jgi:hypothetical protein
MFHKQRVRAKRACPQAVRALQIVLIGFFGLAVSFLLAVYITTPALYVQVLLGAKANADARPIGLTAFLIAILCLVSLLMVGVLRRWRLVFWLVLLAFCFEIIAVPIDALQLAGVMPLMYPVWYTIIRLAVSGLQIAIGGWMIWLYLRCGVWAMGDTTKSADGEWYR